MTLEMIEPDKSAGYPDRRSFSFPMSSPMPNPFIVPQGLVPIPNLSRQHPLAPPQAHPQGPWAAGKNLNRINKTGHKEKEILNIVAAKQQLYLNPVHHLHHLKQQQHQQVELEWIHMMHNSGMNRQAWGEQAASVSPTPSLEYHSSNLNSGSSPPKMQMMDHSIPAGYAYDINSPASMQADSPASNDDVPFSSMFQVLGPQMTAPTGYEANQLQGYNGTKAEREDEMSCFDATRNLATPGQGFEHHPSPSTSPPESFVHWNHTSQASEVNVGFLAPPQNPMAVAQGLHGFPSMPVLTAGYTPRGMPNAVPNFNPSMEQGSTLSVTMNSNRSGSLGNFTMSAAQHRYQASMAATANSSFATAAGSPESMESLYPGSFSDNYELSSSGQHFVLQARHGGSAIQSGCQSQLQQHHQARPTIVYPASVGHNNMDSLEGHDLLTKMSFGTNAPTWTQPSPSMATSTESLPRVTIPSLAQQHENFTSLAQPGNTHSFSQASHAEWGQETSRTKETKGLTQIPESKPRKPLPTSRSLAPKKDKRGRQSSRSRSPTARRPASQASTQSRRPRKQAKRQANYHSSPSAAPQELPVIKSRTNPTDKARALALDEIPTYLQQHDNIIPTPQPEPQPQLPALVPLPHATLPSSPVPAWSLFPIDNPKIGDHVYKYHYPTGGGGATAAKSIIGAGRITPSSRMKFDDIKLIERRKKDEYIFHWKNEGWTYSQIKQAGGFTEAESTLRGRYRMITKEPEERVRKPKWTAIDVKLLERAVRLEAIMPGTGTNSRKRGGGGGGGAQSAGCAQHEARIHANNTISSLSERLFESPPSKMSSSSTGGYYPQEDDEYSIPDFTNTSLGQGYIPYLEFESRPAPPTRAEFLAKYDISKPAQQADLSRPNVKIPWKRVSEEIKRMGGTYTFGSATCRKRWDALVHEHVVKKGKDINEPFYEWLWGDEVFEYFEEDEGEDDDDQEGEVDEDGEGDEDYDEADYDVFDGDGEEEEEDDYE